MQNKKFWFLTTLSSFIATVLGIVVTFGVSKVADMKNARNMQKQCVFSAITDIDNVIDDLHRDSLYLYTFNPWLPDYVEKNASKSAFAVDTAYAYFCSIPKWPSVFIKKSHPVGSDMQNAISPANEYDMQLHRTISQAYVLVDMVCDFQNSLYGYIDYFVKMKLKMEYSQTAYKPDNFVASFLNDEQIQQFAYLIKYTDENKVIDLYETTLRQVRARILKYSGVSEAEYKEFLKEVVERETVSEESQDGTSTSKGENDN